VNQFTARSIPFLFVDIVVYNEEFDMPCIVFHVLFFTVILSWTHFALPQSIQNGSKVHFSQLKGSIKWPQFISYCYWWKMLLLHRPEFPLYRLFVTGEWLNMTIILHAKMALTKLCYLIWNKDNKTRLLQICSYHFDVAVTASQRPVTHRWTCSQCMQMKCNQSDISATSVRSDFHNFTSTKAEEGIRCKCLFI